MSRHDVRFILLAESSGFCSSDQSWLGSTSERYVLTLINRIELFYWFNLDCIPFLRVKNWKYKASSATLVAEEIFINGNEF